MPRGAGARRSTGRCRSLPPPHGRRRIYHPVRSSPLSRSGDGFAWRGGFPFALLPGACCEGAGSDCLARFWLACTRWKVRVGTYAHSSQLASLCTIVYIRASGYFKLDMSTVRRGVMKKTMDVEVTSTFDVTVWHVKVRQKRNTRGLRAAKWYSVIIGPRVTNQVGFRLWLRLAPPILK